MSQHIVSIGIDPAYFNTGVSVSYKSRNGIDICFLFTTQLKKFEDKLLSIYDRLDHKGIRRKTLDISIVPYLQLFFGNKYDPSINRSISPYERGLVLAYSIIDILSHLPIFPLSRLNIVIEGKAYSSFRTNDFSEFTGSIKSFLILFAHMKLFDIDCNNILTLPFSNASKRSITIKCTNLINHCLSHILPINSPSSSVNLFSVPIRSVKLFACKSGNAKKQDMMNQFRYETNLSALSSDIADSYFILKYFLNNINHKENNNG